MKKVVALVMLFAVAVFALPSQQTVHLERLAQIEEIRNTPGVLWTAAVVDRFASQAPGASKPLNGVKGDWRKAVQAGIKSGKIKPFVADSQMEAMAIPDSFDSETNWPQCAKIIGDIRDQSMCGCCWAFAAAEAASDRMCIASNATLLMPLSAQDICFCASDDGCQGGQIDQPWDYIKSDGAVTGGQFQSSGPFGKGYCSDFSLPHCHHHGPQGNDPYPAEGTKGCPQQNSPQCPSKCDANASSTHSAFQGDKYSFSGQVMTASGVKQVQQMIMTGGPVETAFTVYSDFENYAGGIYHHTKGSMAGGHAVKIVGWGKEGGVAYWKVANSWNPYWGEKGYFRIKQGDCGIDDSVVGSSPDSKWAKMSPGPSPGPPGPPGPPTPGCSDAEDPSYCNYVKANNDCKLLAAHCKKTCKCCGKNQPSYCFGDTSQEARMNPFFGAQSDLADARLKQLKSNSTSGYYSFTFTGDGCGGQCPKSGCYQEDLNCEYCLDAWHSNPPDKSYKYNKIVSHGCTGKKVDCPECQGMMGLSRFDK